MSLTPNSELADCREVLAAMDIKIDSISGHLAQCQRELAEARTQYAMLFDKFNSTPCEQIRHSQEAEDFRAIIAEQKKALENIAGGFINSSFVISTPPNWHSAFNQLQELARTALKLAEPK